METTPDLFIDLRSNAQEPGIEIPKGTLLYTVVPRDDIGSSGPYFTEPGRAIYWGFHVMLATRRHIPRPTTFEVKISSGWEQGKLASRYIFPTEEMVLLEIKTDRKIIFGSFMLDSNPYSYVNYRYGAHDPISFPVQVNLDDKNISLIVKNTCKEHSWSQPAIQRVLYYGLLAMIPLTVFKGSVEGQPPKWIVKDSQGRVDVNLSLDQLTAVFRSLDLEGAPVESYHENIIETGLRICRPSELIAQRSYFVIKWETVWLAFIGFLSQASTSLTIKDYFINNVMQLLVPVRMNLDTGQTLMSLDRLVLARIVSWCASICDALAFCSINRRMREGISPLPIVQKILRLKFMPRMNNFFAVLPFRDSAEREDLLGIPAKSTGHRWWRVGSVLFAEDFDEVDDIGHLGARSTQSIGTPSLVVDPYRPLSKAQSHVLARYGSAGERFVTLQLESSLISPLVRGCNSFISMFSMLYSMTNYSSTPRSCQMSIHIHDVHGNIDLVSQVTASMPFEPMRTAGASPLELLRARPTASYREAVRRIGPSGSWLHDNGTPYFFLDPSFSSHLDKAKAFELQRYDITTYSQDPTKRRLLTSDHLKTAKISLNNDLLMYRGSELVALIRCSMKGGFEQKLKMVGMGGIQHFVGRETDNDHIIIFASGLSDETMDKLENLTFHGVYEVQTMQGQYHIASFRVRPDVINWWSKSLIDGVHITEILRGQIRGIFIGLPKLPGNDELYYAAYMSLCCIIRLILHDGCDRVEWRTNF